MRRKNGVRIVLAALISAACCSVNIQAAELQEDTAEDRDYVLGRPMTEEEIAAIEAEVAPLAGAGGYLEEESDYIYAQGNAPVVMSLELPQAYDVRKDGIDITIEAQRYGDCWAFAALDLLQINGQKQGIIGNIDLSERHLAYYTYHSVCGTSGQQSEEGTTFLDYGQTTQCFWYGGKYDYAIRSLSSYLGAVPEEEAPYSEAALPLPDAGDAYSSAILRLKGAYAFPAADRNMLKRMVLQYGAVGITYCSSLGYYEYDTAAQYCPDDMRADHAVTVIGWDDDYRKENFRTQPESDGAWLVQNTWGTVFGDQGFFWLSYEDASIAETAYVLEAAADSCSYIYQCDNTILDGSEMAEGKLQVANCYTLESVRGCEEILRAVNITVPTGGMEYRLELYDLTGGKSIGEQSLLTEPVTGQIAFPGNITIELPDGVVLPYGARVGVALTLYGEMAGIYTDTTLTSGRIVCCGEGGMDTSYIMTDGRWEDYGAGTNQNFRIKLLTDPGKQTQLAVQEVYENYLRIDDRQQAVEYLYRQLLQRQGEAEGIAYWQAYCQDNEPIMVLAGFLWSPEFEQKHPGEDTAADIARCIELQTGVTTEDICRLYRDILQREYDIPGLLYWLERKSEGMALEEMERLFYLSPEYQYIMIAPQS